MIMTTGVVAISTKAENITEIEKNKKAPDFFGAFDFVFRTWISWDSGRY